MNNAVYAFFSSDKCIVPEKSTPIERCTPTEKSTLTESNALDGVTLSCGN